ncbi:MAG: DsbA family protein [Propionibacteriaceae bacterium]|jgi:protein-disulfide isomerase|nr:DsbA family protein [Propionibacteriaceae bacterium]
MANARQRLHERKAAEAKRRKAIRATIIGVIVLAVVGSAITVAMLVQNANVAPADPAGFPPNATANNDGIAFNQAEGVPVVEIYSDYQCPWCGRLEKTYGSAFTQLAAEGKIQLINHTKTFLDPSLGNDSSTNAAIGAACADFAGVFPGYHAAVFANQPEQEGDGYPVELLRDTIPAQLGLTGETLTAFQQCYDTRATAGFVRQVDEAAMAAGVGSTPTVKVNGNELDLNKLFETQPADLMSLIDSVK